MKKARLRALLLAWLTLSTAGPAAFAAKPELGSFISYETAGDVVVYSTRGEAQVRELMTQLAQFQLLLETTISKRKMQVTGTPTYVFIVSGREWREFLQPNEGIAGLFLRQPFANYLLIDGDANRSNALPVIFHEFTHYFMATETTATMPAWMNEGLAENLSMATFENGVAVYEVPMQRVLDARAGQWIPFDRLLAIDSQSPEYQEHRLARGFYGQAWLTVHYALMSDKEFWQNTHAYIRDIGQLVPSDVAARRAFGDNLAEVDNRLRAYSHQQSFKALTTRIGATPPLTLSAARKLDDAEALATVSDVMLALALAPERVRPLADALTALEPQSPRSALLRMKLANQTQEHARFESEADVLVPRLAREDWLSRRETAMLLLDRALENATGRARREDLKPEFEQALRLFDEALAQKPDDCQSLWGWGTAALHLNRDLALAEKRLKASYTIMPYNALIGLSLASVYGAQGRPQAMIPVLNLVLRTSNQGQVRRFATDMLEQAHQHIAQIEEIESRRSEAQRKRTESGRP